MRKFSYKNDDNWTPRTFADEIIENSNTFLDNKVRVLTSLPESVDYRSAAQTKVRCPNCSRHVLACSLVDVRNVDDFTQDWVCDGCKSNLIRPGINQSCSECEFVALLGAPKHVVDRLKIIDEKRKVRGWKTEHRGRIDLDSIPNRARNPRDVK